MIPPYSGQFFTAVFLRLPNSASAQLSDQTHYCRARDRAAADDARQDALDLQHKIGPDPRGSDKRRLQNAWMSYQEEHERHDAMVQDAMEQLMNEYPYGFDHA